VRADQSSTAAIYSRDDCVVPWLLLVNFYPRLLSCVTVIVLYRGCFVLFLPTFTLVCDRHLVVPWLLCFIFTLVYSRV
jgi:hypothetical protein